ncbi:MAG: GNAT family N-acetyltransferase [Actinobacteria bacterium]|uniref:Unannotated protein n=1 Tax=freshwater metagenome TaxID=449393 RepID=A0A6J7CWS7_9ZZZZ|nr:GNAT family N-acetyltransferase [Actinomycetota bacterium]
MSESLKIQGPNLVLRFAQLSDAPQLFEIGSDVETTRYLSWGPYTELSQAESFIGGMPRQVEAGEELGFLVTRGDEVLGVTAFTEPRPRDRSVVIGTWLTKPEWGTGVNTELKAMMAALAFRAMGIDRLSVYAAVTNERSRGALGKVGFTEEGTLRRFHRHGDDWYDCVVGSVLRDEYEVGPLAAVPVQITGDVPANWIF